MKARLYLLVLALFVLSGAAQDTFALDRWHILALRVSFPQESPDNPTTSGDGAFDLRDLARARPDYRFLYDTPPHDRTYFEAHLRALAHYYRAASDGQVEITFEVWPRGLSDSYRLPRTLLSYGNGRTRQEVAVRITELFRDGIAAADSAEGGRLDFSAYRAYAVFHAGIGAEARSGRAFNDIPSAFISEQDLLRYAGGAVRVQGGRHAVRSGLLLPEAISADGRGGLNGTLARFFGSQLGLPGLSNFRDDLPAAGGWSLMDVGSNRVIPREIAERLPGFVRDATGLIGFAPVLPEAWSRSRLGWIAPLVVTRDTALQIAAADLATPLPRAVKVPITSDEYFLLENRQSRLRPGEVPKVVFSRGDSGGVWLSMDRIDAFIPGSGILIWHVDEAVTREAGEDRGVNDDPHRRGLRLVEADGYSDIGNVYVPFDRVDQIEGGPDDPFYATDRQSDAGGKAAEFGPSTNPATKSNAGYGTGIRILVKSPAQDTMTVSISFDRTGGRWPITGLPAFGGNAVRALDLDGDGSKEIVAETPDGRLYAYRASGRPHGEEGLWAATGDSSAFTPAVGDVDGDGSEDLITAGASGLVSARSGLKGLLWSVRLSSRPSTPPTVADLGAGPLVLLGGAGGDLIALNGRDGRAAGWSGPVANAPIAGLAVGDIDGDKRNEVVVVASDGGVYAAQELQRRRVGGAPGRVSRPPAVGDLDGDGKAEVVVVMDDGTAYFVRDGATDRQSVAVVRASASGIRSAPVIADADADGFLEVLAGGAGLQVLRRNGIAQAGTPFVPPARDRATPVEAPPVVADVDGDGKLDLLFAAGDYIYGVRGDGSPLPGFPIASVGRVVASPLLEDLDGDGGLELVALTSTGALNRWDLRRIDGSLKGKQVVWGQAGGGPGNRNASLSVTPPPPPASDALLPAGRVYCYPNPIEGPEARLRFYLGREARVEVKVFNAAADLVGSMTLANAVPRAENEMAWDTTGYATGLYVCRVEAVGADGRREVRFVKVAIKR